MVMVYYYCYCGCYLFIVIMVVIYYFYYYLLVGSFDHLFICDDFNITLIVLIVGFIHFL